MRSVSRVHLATVDSTNAFARRAVRAGSLEASRLTVVTAVEQTAGRGRLSRSWLSSADDIKLSFAFALPPAALPTAYLLSALASVATCRAAAAAAGTACGVKWPNDVVAGGARKVGGILCEMEAAGGVGGGGGGGGGTPPSFWAIVGIGLNVNSMPEGMLAELNRPQWPASTLRAEAGRQIDAAALTEALVAGFAQVRRHPRARCRTRFARRERVCRPPAFLPFLPGARAPQNLEVFLARGFAPFADEYQALSVLLGRRVTFHTDAPHVGIVVGHGEDGALLLQIDGCEGPPNRFLAGEVTRLVLDGGAVAESAAAAP